MPSTSLKRKTLHDNFQGPSELLVPPEPPNSHNIPALPITPNFVIPNEQATLLSLLDAAAWRTDLSRRTIHYGGTYCLMQPKTASAEEREAISKTIITAAPILDDLTWLIDRMITNDLCTAETPPTFCIVCATSPLPRVPAIPSPQLIHTRNEYTQTHGISAHVENFRFGEPVCSLTLSCADFMRFHELSAPHDGSVRSFKAIRAPRMVRGVDVWLPVGSLLVPKGDARERWQHKIVGRRRRKGRGSSGGG
jgi:hypothetical protein